ncbi:unnamed protein product [Moneuplotes crassus]|uniref:Uncharacterized protein n=1 Tax=Euplotes crassus TaxID=5936 RepID=A0AAD1Y7P4_EUPCR|nr:unnamed protein product [Moneuplotes crassus]
MEECPICFRDFNNTLKAYMLNCGHYFCLEDVQSMYKDSEGMEENKEPQGKTGICCYICKQHHFVNSFDNISKEVVVKKLTRRLPKEELKLDCTMDRIDNFMKSDQNSEYDEVEGSEDEEEMIEQNKEDELDIELQPGFKCGTHNQLLHSYIISNHVLLCNECIEEKKLHDDRYKPIPRVVKQIKRALDDQKFSIEEAHNKLKYFKSSLKVHLDTKKRKCIQKTLDYFKKLKQMILSEEIRAFERLDEVFHKIEENTYGTNNINGILETVAGKEKEIQCLIDFPEQELVKFYEDVKALTHKNERFYKLKKYRDFDFEFKSKTSLLSRIQELIKGSWSFNVKKTKKKEIKTIMKKCLDADSYWNCMKCSKRNLCSKNLTQCKHCESCRPLRSFKSISDNRKDINKDDLKKINLRRSREHKEVQRLTKLVEELEENNVMHLPYYFIEKEWYNQWNVFVTNNKEDRCYHLYKSHIEKLGVIDPVKIDNSLLFSSTGELKRGLTPENDFEAVGQPVWEYLYKLYGGGPIIKRETKDIYSLELDTSEEEKRQEKILQQREKTNLPTREIEELNTKFDQHYAYIESLHSQLDSSLEHRGQTRKDIFDEDFNFDEELQTETFFAPQMQEGLGCMDSPPKRITKTVHKTRKKNKKK